MDYQRFVEGRKTFIVAPAGYGKTHSIVECLTHTKGLQLILTHTHAGVSSIKEKIKKKAIPSNRYRVETISSFVQKYVNAFYTGDDMPDQDDRNYHSFILEKSLDIFQTKIIRTILKNTYQGLFVDEYQDCSKKQHIAIMRIAEILPTHIFGDPLQSIFDFNGEVVSFEDDLNEFEKFQDLDTPWRWNQGGNNSELGAKIKEFRKNLIDGLQIELNSNTVDGFSYIYVNPIHREDFKKKSAAYSRASKLIQNAQNEADLNNLLILVPDYQRQSNSRGGEDARAGILKLIDYKKEVVLLEAIDGRKFYEISKAIDKIIDEITNEIEQVKRIYDFLLSYFFQKKPLDNWFNYKKNTLKNKQNPLDKIISEKLNNVVNHFIKLPSPKNLQQIIDVMKHEVKAKAKYDRQELMSSILYSLKKADVEGTDVYTAMKQHRNNIRRMGRRIDGKCLGTVLLTKGLEFDTVVILDADKFECKKQLYVALSRACKRLYVFSSTPILNPKTV